MRETGEMADIYKLTPVTPDDLAGSAFSEFAYLWSENGQFWSSASCRSTFSSTPNLISSAAMIDHDGHWHAWYLALESGDAMELLWIYARTESRKAGLAKKLLERLLIDVRSTHQSKHVFLEVRAGNVAAIRLYESLGFHKLSRRSGYYNDGEDAIVYKKDL